MTGLGTSLTTGPWHAASTEVAARRQRDVLARLESPNLTSETLAAISGALRSAGWEPGSARREVTDTRQAITSHRSGSIGELAER